LHVEINGGIVDIGPYVALVALIVGIPYMVWKRQWALTAYFALTAAAIVASTFFAAADVAVGLTWLSLLALVIGVFQLLKLRKAAS
jgi:hypothetical protein